MTRPGILWMTACGAVLLMACGEGPSTTGMGTTDTSATAGVTTTANSSSGTTTGATAPTDAMGTTAATDATSTTAATDATSTDAATDATSTAATTGGACPIEQACDEFFCCEEGEFCEIGLYCREKCYPLQPTCGPNAVCIPSMEDLFYCASQAEPGAAGDPCVCSNCCDPGLLCFPGTYVQGCESDDCCAPLCDLSNPSACPGAMETCQSVYKEGTAPAGYENVGICSLPF